LASGVSDRVTIEGRGVGGDPAHDAAMCSNHFPQPFQKATNVLVFGVMVEHLVQQAALSSAIDDRQDAK
jgi:hypothetical protein